MSKMAAVVFGALTGHFKVLTELCLVGVGQILKLFLGGDTGRILCVLLVLVQ